MNAAARRMIRSRLLLAGLLAALAPLAGAAPRVLIESEDAQVHLPGDLRCSRDAEVMVVARDPALFTGDSARLQSLLDATHALLGFECRNLPGMVVTGRLAGLDATAYQAVAGSEGGWRLQPSRTMQMSAPGSVAVPAAWRPAAPGEASVADFAVRDLRRGMGVDAAMEVVRRGFDSEPRYDPERQVLSVVDGGCPIAGEDLHREVSLRPGDVCLEVEFLGSGDERLDRLTYGQVVDDDQSAAIRAVLEQRYGRPEQILQPSPATTRLGWGERAPGQAGRHELEARIDVRDTGTVLVLRLQGADEAPRYTIDF